MNLWYSRNVIKDENVSNELPRIKFQLLVLILYVEELAYGDF
jgi:hypothetical protein